MSTENLMILRPFQYWPKFLVSSKKYVYYFHSLIVLHFLYNELLLYHHLSISLASFSFINLRSVSFDRGEIFCPLVEKCCNIVMSSFRTLLTLSTSYAKANPSLLGLISLSKHILSRQAQSSPTFSKCSFLDIV